MVGSPTGLTEVECSAASPLDIPSLIAGPRRAQKLSVNNLELCGLFLPALRPRDMKKCTAGDFASMQRMA